MKIISKPPIIILLLVASLFFSSASPVFAQSTAVPGAVDALTSKSTDNKGCQFKSAAGLLKDGKVFESAECLPQDLIAYMNALNTFFYRLAIVLAVLMITIGGMQWLMAIGNAGKIGKAKDTIQDAVVGLILALVAILLFNQIDSSFTELKTLNLTRPVIVGKECNAITLITECAATEGCKWFPNDPKKPLEAGTCREASYKFEGCGPQQQKEAEARWTRRVESSGQPGQYCYINLTERECLSYDGIKNGLKCCEHETDSGFEHMYAVNNCKSCPPPAGVRNSWKSISAYWSEKRDTTECDQRGRSEILEQ